MPRQPKANRPQWAALLQEYRDRLNYKQSDLGAMINMSVTYIRKYEAGNVMPTCRIISRLAIALELNKPQTEQLLQLMDISVPYAKLFDEDFDELVANYIDSSKVKIQYITEEQMAEMASMLEEDVKKIRKEHPGFASDLSAERIDLGEDDIPIIIRVEGKPPIMSSKRDLLKSFADIRIEVSRMHEEELKKQLKLHLLAQSLPFAMVKSMAKK